MRPLRASLATLTSAAAALRLPPGASGTPGAARPDRKGRLVRKYAALLVGLVGGALVANSAIESYYSYYENRDALIAVQREKAHGAAAVIEAFVREIEGQVGWTTHASFLPGASGTDQRRFDFLRLLRQAPAITEVSWLDGDGREQIKVSRLAMDVLASGADFSGDAKFAEARARRRYVSRVYFRKESEPYLTLSIAGSGRTSGVTVAEVNLKFIWDVVSRIRVGRAGVAYVIDARGLLIAHPDIGLVLRKTDLSKLDHVAAARQRIGAKDAPEPPAISRDAAGRDVLTASAAIDTLGWLVFVDLPRAEALRPVYDSLLRTGLVLLAGLGLAMFAGLWLARRMVVPIEAVAAGAARIGDGDLDHRIDIRTGDEVETLAHGFNEMGGRLKAYYAGLEQTVADRTRELQQSLEYQTATSDVLGVISRSPSELQPVLDAIIATAGQLCEADYAHCRLERDGLYPVVASTSLDPGQIERVPGKPVAADRSSVSGRVVLERRTIHVPDVAADPEDTYSKSVGLPARTVLGVPLMRDGVAIGVIVLFRKEVRPFTQRQIDLVTTFANQAVIAINNVRLFEEVQARTRDLTESLEYQTAISEVLGVISRSPNEVQPVFDTILRTAARLCEAEFAIYFKLQDGQYLPAAANNAQADYVRYCVEHPIRPGRSTVVGRTALDRSVVHLPDCLADPEYDREFARAGKQRSMLGVPLLRDDLVIGVIALQRTAIKPFTGKQIELVTTFADQAVIAIENARLFEEVQARTREVTEALEYQTATSEVLGVISRSPSDLQPVLDSIAQTAGRLCDADVACIFQLREDGRYHVVAANQAKTEFVTYLREHPIAPGRDTVTGRAAMERQTVHIPDVFSDPDYTWTEMARRGGYRSNMGVPLLRDGLAVGVITVMHYGVKPFTQKQIDLVTTFADQAVIAINNVGLFEEVQTRTAELQESLEYQTATSDVLGVISRSPSEIDPVLDSIVKTAARLCHADHATIFRLHGGKYHVAASDRADAEFVAYLKNNPMAPGRESLVARTALERRTVHLPDALADPEYTWFDSQRIGNFRSMLGVPLLRHGEPIGVIALARTAVEPFTTKQIDLVTTFADQAVIAIENARLFEEVQARTRELTESLEQQTATSDVLKVINASPGDLAPVFEAMLGKATQLCNAKLGILWTYDGEAFTIVAERGTPSPKAAFGEEPLRAGPMTGLGRIAHEKRIVHIPDVIDDLYQAGDAVRILTVEKLGARTWIGVPLLKEGTLLGAFTIYRGEVRPFSDKEIALLASFADQAVIAINNMGLFEEVQARTKELQESLEYQTATSDVLGVISRSPSDVQPVLDAIVATAARLCNADRGLIRRREGETYHLASTFGFSEEFRHEVAADVVRPGPGSLAGRVALERRTVHLPDVLEDTAFERARLQRLGDFRSMVGVPLLREGSILGVLMLFRKAANPFTDKQIALLETFADQAVIAIENARLFEQVQARTRDLAQSVGELTALSEVGQAISSTLDLDAVLDAILSHACRMADAGGGAIYAFDKVSEEFSLAATHGMSPELTEAIRRTHPRLHDATPVGHSALTRTAVQIADLEAETGPGYPLREAFIKAGVRALLAVPLLHQDQVVGALVVRRKRVGAFAPETIGLLQAFATQSAIAIDNARLFQEIEDKSRQLEIASQHKSQFLANMSHELRTPLNAILGYAELIQDGLYGEPSPKMKDVLERVQSNGRHLLGLINDVLDLSKIEAGQLTLSINDYAMSDIVHTVVTATGSLAAEKKLPVMVDVPSDLPAGRGDERRIAQVLLNLVGNAIKFTDAGEVRIGVSAAKGVFRVAVRDTGPGIAPAEQTRIFEEFHQVDSSNTKAKGGTGLGLAIARRIVDLHGGRLWVESEPGQGATFHVELPVRVEERKGAA